MTQLLFTPMTPPELAMWGVVGCVGLLSRHNLTAFALALSWLVGQSYYLHTGDNLATSEYFMADVAVITLIYAKTIRRVGPKTYPSAWLHLKCFFLDLTICDRLIVAIFLLGSWPVYVIEIDKYWPLYWLTVSQFLFAGAEALLSWHRRRNAPQEPLASAEIIPFVVPTQYPHRPALLLARGDDGVRC
jgi:hypothetical protein